jgi:hypothetical protein
MRLVQRTVNSHAKFFLSKSSSIFRHHLLPPQPSPQGHQAQKERDDKARGNFCSYSSVERHLNALTIKRTHSASTYDKIVSITDYTVFEVKDIHRSRHSEVPCFHPIWNSNALFGFFSGLRGIVD